MRYEDTDPATRTELPPGSTVDDRDRMDDPLAERPSDMDDRVEPLDARPADGFDGPTAETDPPIDRATADETVDPDGPANVEDAVTTDRDEPASVDVDEDRDVPEDRDLHDVHEDRDLHEEAMGADEASAPVDSVAPEESPALGEGLAADQAEPAAGLPAESPAELMPGDVPAASITALWTGDTATGFRDRWRDIQLRFVDDPRAAAAEAQALVTEVIDALSEAVSRQKNDLDSWASAEGGDTEELRVTVRRYRDFLDRILGM